MRQSWLLLLTCLVGCTQDLPSMVPLGRGPWAEAEPDPRQKLTKPSHDAGPPKPRAPTKTHGDSPASEAPADAGTSLALADAGKADSAAPTSDGSEASAKVTGHYQGFDVSTFRIANFPTRTERDPNAKTDVEQKPKGRLAITLIDSSNGSTICSLDAELVNDKANLGAGQSCFGGGEMSSTLTSGSGRFTGTKLTLDMVFALQADIGGETVSGELEYHFEGARR